MAIWDADRKVTVTANMLHDNTGYTPYEGMELTGWPVTVLSRGRVVVDNGELNAEKGSGVFLPLRQAGRRQTARPDAARTRPEAQFRRADSVLGACPSNAYELHRPERRAC